MWRVAWLLWLAVSIMIGFSAGAFAGIGFGALSGVALFFVALIVDGQRTSIPELTTVHPRHDRYLPKTHAVCSETPERERDPQWYDVEQDFVAMPPPVVTGDPNENPLYLAWLLREQRRVNRLRRRDGH
jgi:hypothetical protein